MTASTQARASRRLVVSGELVATSAVHVGSGDESVADLPLALDGTGHPVLPGTSLAGSLRRAAARAGWDAARVAKWFGKDLGARGPASRVYIDDATAPATRLRETRTTTAIDSKNGVALPGSLFSREVLPAGTRFKFGIEVEEEPGPPAKLDLDALLRLLADGIEVGAATSRGLGSVALDPTSLTQEIVPLTQKQAFLDYLRAPAPQRYELPSSEPTYPRLLRVTLTFRAVAALLSSVALDGASVDRVPLVAGSALDRVRFVLPGSSVKGALRARAEFISHALGVPTDEESPLSLLFGYRAEMRRSDGKQGESKQLGRRGRLRVADIVHRDELDRARWEAVVSAAPFETEGQRNARLNGRDTLKTAIRNLGAGSPFLAITDRVAIDRWTGGAADGQLYALLEPHSQPDAHDWSPIALDCDLSGIETVQANKALALLLLTIKDVAEGWVPLGYGTRKGLGHIEVDDWSFAVGNDLGDWTNLADWDFTQRDIAPAVLAGALEVLTSG